jgi:beta-lactamase superfamily II metal-dependent hydrolase
VTFPLSRPSSAEIEVSLFGPRYGECLVIHVGDGDWIVVDSCVGPRTSQPVALEYLQQIGVDASRQVQLIVATHWHDDHVRGISELVAACPRAEVYCSAALQVREFYEALVVYGAENPLNLQSKASAGVRELRRVLDVLGDRTLALALASARIWQRTTKTGDRAEVWSLSPSQLEVRLTQRMLGREFRRLLHDGGQVGRQPAGRIARPRHNHGAVALWITVGKIELLLGSDLEEPGHAGLGWTAVVRSTTRPKGLASFVKVPHHGSKSGHLDAMWTDMTQADCISGVTPFILGRHKLPTEADIARIKEHRPTLYQTAPARARTAKVAVSAVRKTIAEAARRFEDRHPPFGQVRWRKAIGTPAPPTVEMNGAAFRR